LNKINYPEYCLELHGCRRIRKFETAASIKNIDGSEATSGGLTPREVECLQALAEGLTNDGIARRFAIALPTVAMHLVNARHKLGAATREHAVAIAVRKGVIK